MIEEETVHEYEKRRGEEVSETGSVASSIEAYSDSAQGRPSLAPAYGETVEI